MEKQSFPQLIPQIILTEFEKKTIIILTRGQRSAIVSDMCNVVIPRRKKVGSFNIGDSPP